MAHVLERTSRKNIITQWLFFNAVSWKLRVRFKHKILNYNNFGSTVYNKIRKIIEMILIIELIILYKTNF